MALLKQQIQIRNWITLVIAVVACLFLLTACMDNSELSNQSETISKQNTGTQADVIITPEDLDAFWRLENPKQQVKIQETLPEQDATVTVRFTITSEGTTTNVSIVDASPNEAWNSFARAIIEQHRFAPSLSNSNRQSVITYKTLSFTSS